jgi:hypothetical protein
MDEKTTVTPAAADAPADVQPVEPIETVEIVHDFSRISLDDMLDMMEESARVASGEPSSPQEYLKFLRSIRKTFVRSSRPLTGADFTQLSQSFWNSFNEVRNPKN